MAIAGARLRIWLMMLLAMINVTVVGGVDIFCDPNWPVVTVDDRHWC